MRGDPDFNDGALFAGIGLGNPDRIVATEFTLASYDLIGDTFRDRSLSLKVHRRIGSAWSAALGVENLWIAGQTDGGRSTYAVVSRSVDLASIVSSAPLMTITLGIGDGRFNLVQEIRREENGWNAFGSLGVRISAQIGLFGTWTGQDLNLGFSFVPFENVPIVLSSVLLDVTTTAGSRVRPALSIGVAHTLR